MGNASGLCLGGGSRGLAWSHSMTHEGCGQTPRAARIRPNAGYVEMMPYRMLDLANGGNEFGMQTECGARSFIFLKIRCRFMWALSKKARPVHHTQLDSHHACTLGHVDTHRKPLAKLTHTIHPPLTPPRFVGSPTSPFPRYAKHVKTTHGYTSCTPRLAHHALVPTNMSS